MSMVSAAMSVVGGAVSAMGAMQQAESEAQAHEYNAAVAARNEKVIGQQTQAAKIDQRVENQRVYHGVRALYGATGFSMTGSALDVMADTKREQLLDVKRIGYRGKLAQIEERDKRNLELMGADNARAAGSISAISAILGGVGGAATTIARAA